MPDQRFVPVAGKDRLDPARSSIFSAPIKL
jgi:hypothetical protein